MITPRTNYSDKYQHIFCEIPVDLDFLNSFSDPLVQQIKQQEIETLLDLDEQLRLKMWEHIDLHLTAHQRTVLQMTYLGYTQWEIADKLGVIQSSIAKCLQGNCDYSGSVMKRYGGVAKKLMKLILNDNEVKAIMQQIEAMHNNDLPIKLPHYRCFSRFPGSFNKYLQWLSNGE